MYLCISIIYVSVYIYIYIYSLFIRLLLYQHISTPDVIFLLLQQDCTGAAQRLPRRVLSRVVCREQKRQCRRGQRRKQHNWQGWDYCNGQISRKSWDSGVILCSYFLHVICYIYIYVYIYVYIYICIYIYVYIYVCMCIYICIYIYMHRMVIQCDIPSSVMWLARASRKSWCSLMIFPAKKTPIPRLDGVDNPGFQSLQVSENKDIIIRKKMEIGKVALKQWLNYFSILLNRFIRLPQLGSTEKKRSSQLPSTSLSSIWWWTFPLWWSLCLFVPWLARKSHKNRAL